MRKVLLVFVLFFRVMLPLDAHADACSPLQLSLFTPVQIIPKDMDVCGFRFNLIYGNNRKVSGLDIGLINRTTDTFKGLELAGLGNRGAWVYGIQAALLPLGRNYAANTIQGVQVGTGNIAMDGGAGLQVGVFNQAVNEEFKGIQIGLLNYCQSLTGIQIGLLNHAADASVPWLPIINAHF